MACHSGKASQDVNGQQSETSAFDAVKSWEQFEGLIRLFYAYLERDDFDVDAQLARSKQLAVQAKTDADFRRILHQTAYMFTDPHFIVGPFGDDDYNIIPTSSDLKVNWQGGKLMVVDVRAGSDAALNNIQPDWVLTHIDGDEVVTAAKKPFGDIAESLTGRQLNYGANLAVNGRRKGERTLSFMTGQGDIKTITLPSPREFARRINDAPAIISQRLPSANNAVPQDRNYGVLKINNQLGNNDLIAEFDKALEAVLETDGLILDLRNTPSGGNTEVARSIMGHFVTEARPYQIHEIPSLEREFTVPRRFVEYVKPRTPYYGKPVVVLGGHWTGSMGEGVVIGMDAAAGAHTVVSDMGDLLGALSNYNLNYSSARIDFGNETLFHVNGLPREDFEGDIFLPASDVISGGQNLAMSEAVRWLDGQ